MKPEYASIIGVLVGALIPAIATIIVAKIQRQPKEGSDPAPTIVVVGAYERPPKKQSLWSRSVLFVVGIAGALVGGYIGYLVSVRYGPTTSITADSLPVTAPVVCSFSSELSARHAFPPGALTGVITSPIHCETGLLSSIYSPITVEGNVGKLPFNTYAWLFVYAPDGKYYPQCNDVPANKSNCTLSGEWSMRTYFGDECKSYFLVLVSTDGGGKKFLLDTMDQWEANKSYTGLRGDELKPYEIEELYSVQVETGNCATETPTP